MMGHQLRKCPAVEQWADALDSNEELPTAWETHIEQCMQCRHTLDYLTSDDAFVGEVQQRLSNERVAVPQFGSKILALSGHDSNQRCTEPSEVELTQLRQWLEPPSHPELIGTLGRYELHQLVGRGGMGLVFRARDLELQRVVAVKTLSLHLASLGAARERFAREGRAIASLSHPHIVQVYDVVIDQQVPALVMQYVPGQTLEDRIEAYGPIGVDDTLRIAGQLLSALAAAHESGLVHRDIKPGNVLLEADGSRALLSDFGLVRALDDASLTHSGFLAGTPHYMSPEQARGSTVDARSDLFSFGSLVYTMLAGHPPFRAPEPMAVLHRICNERHRPLQQVDARIPVELSRWVDRLLAKEAERRFASAALAREALVALSNAPRRLVAARSAMRRTVVTSLVALAATVVLAVGLSRLYPGGRSQADIRTTRQHDVAQADASAEANRSTETNPGKLDAAEQSLVPRAAAYLQTLRNADAETDSFSTFRHMDARIEQLSTEIEGLLSAEAHSAVGTTEWSNADRTLQNIDAEIQRLRQER